MSYYLLFHLAAALLLLLLLLLLPLRQWRNQVFLEINSHLQDGSTALFGVYADYLRRALRGFRKTLEDDHD
jgi:hypothetical protein